MTHYKGNVPQPVAASGRQGAPGSSPKETGGSQGLGPRLTQADGVDTPAASDLQDRRGGAYDNVAPKPAHPMKEHRTVRQDAQGGADMRPETEPSDDSVPEGLKRERKGPYSPVRGRATEVPTHVPQASKQEA